MNICAIGSDNPIKWEQLPLEVRTAIIEGVKNYTYELLEETGVIVEKYTLLTDTYQSNYMRAANIKKAVLNLKKQIK